MLARAALALLLLAACGRGRVHSTEVQRLEAKAAEALAEGRPHLAQLLVGKAFTSGHLSAAGDVTAARAEAAQGDTSSAIGSIESAEQLGFDDADALLATSELKPLAGDPAFIRALERMRSRRAGAPPPVGAGLERTTPEAARIDAAALHALLREAERTHTSGLVLLRDGKLVGDWYFGEPKRRIEAMSATKSVVSLAIGLLIEDGKIRSLDQPVSDFFPAWRGGPHAGVTVRHLLSHTSGLAARVTTEEIYASDDFVKLALDAAQADPPGTRFFYNNKATNLLAGVASAAAGEPMDEYLRRRLFEPLGITDVTWSRDAAGNRHGMSGLQIHPLDFAKIGQLLLDGGTWNGRQIVPAEWIAVSTSRASQPLRSDCALLWWRVPVWSKYALDDDYLLRLGAAGAPRSLVDALRPLVGRSFTSMELRDVFEKDLRHYQATLLQRFSLRRGVMLRGVASDEVVGYSARGFLGQFLVVLPRERLVAVRMSSPPREVPRRELGMGDFEEQVRLLVGAPAPEGEDSRFKPPNEEDARDE